MRRNPLEYKHKRVRSPLWWHWVYSPLWIRNWLLLIVALIVSGWIAFFLWIVFVLSRS